MYKYIGFKSFKDIYKDYKLFEQISQREKYRKKDLYKQRSGDSKYTGSYCICEGRIVMLSTVQ